jgi:stearoyl-CoA desaturase (delta-9 desaturase)
VDPDTLEAVIRCRYDVLARYARSLKRIYAEELRKLRRRSPQEARTLQTMYSMRRELAALWGRSRASREQLVRQLQDWCARAEASGIRPLAEFSQRLRSYA